MVGAMDLLHCAEKNCLRNLHIPIDVHILTVQSISSYCNHKCLQDITVTQYRLFYYVTFQFSEDHQFVTPLWNQKDRFFFYPFALYQNWVSWP